MVGEESVSRDKQRGIFITGGTGFLGSNLVLNLLLEDKCRLFCLARPGNQMSAQERLIQAVKDAADMSGMNVTELTDKFKQITVVPGDLTEPMLGIPDSDMDEMKSHGVDLIWHCAAFLKFEEAYRDEVFKHNVEGTRAVIDVVKEIGIREFNHVSTAYVAGSRSGEINEGPCDTTFQPNNPYEDSKRSAEQILWETCAQKSFSLRIFRPSIVIGNSKTYKTSSDFSFYGFVSALDRYIEWIQNRMPDYFEHHPFFIYREEGTTLDMVPVDVLVSEAIAISKEGNGSPEVHHLTNPFPLTIDRVVNALNRSFPGVQIKVAGSRETLGPMDHIFRSKLNFYNPYLMNDKNFLRRRSAEKYAGALEYSEQDLINYVEEFMKKTQEEKKNSQRKSVQVMELLEKKTIRCRYDSKLVYYRIGEGPAVVLVNPVGISLQTWKWVISTLCQKYSVITWEGRGLADLVSYNDDQGCASDVLFTVDEQARDLEEILENEGIQQAHVIAWCAGVKAALVFSNNHPERIFSLTLLAGNYAPLNGLEGVNSEFNHLLSSMSDTLVKSPRMAGLYVKTISDIFSNELDLSDITESDTRLIDILGMVSPKFRNMILRPFLSEDSIRRFARVEKAFEACDISDCLEKINAPSFIILAQNDNIAVPELSETVAKRIKNSKMLCLPAATHWFVIENGEEVARELESFLASSEREDLLKTKHDMAVFDFGLLCPFGKRA